jgi:hypothetical protein
LAPIVEPQFGNNAQGTNRMADEEPARTVLTEEQRSLVERLSGQHVEAMSSKPKTASPRADRVASSGVYLPQQEFHVAHGCSTTKPSRTAKRRKSRPSGSRAPRVQVSIGVTVGHAVIAVVGLVDPVGD